MSEHATQLVTDDACRTRHSGTNRMLSGLYLLLACFVAVAGWSGSVAWSESGRIANLETDSKVQAEQFKMIDYRLNEIQKGVERLQTSGKLGVDQ